MEQPEQSEHEAVADEFDRRADEMEHENAKLSDEIDAVRKDWEAKRTDPAVPGAVPPASEPGPEAASESRPDPD